MKKNFSDRSADWATYFAVNARNFTGGIIPIVSWASICLTFRFSEIGQSVISTIVIPVTLILFFFLQKTQNKDPKAIQIKLNRLIGIHEKTIHRMKISNVPKGVNPLNFINKLKHPSISVGKDFFENQISTD